MRGTLRLKAAPARNTESLDLHRRHSLALPILLVLAVRSLLALALLLIDDRGMLPTTFSGRVRADAHG